MNMKEATNALTAAKYAGMDVRLTGRYTIRRIYSRIGDTMPFNPYLSLEDIAMLAMNCNLKLDFGADCFKVAGDGQELAITGLAKSSQKQKIKRIGNAIVNLIVQISKADKQHARKD